MSEEKEEKTKIGFFQKVWNSITKIEKYPDMAAEGLGRAFTYLCKVVAILAIVVNVLVITHIIKRAKEQKKYPYTNEIFVGTKDYKLAMERAAAANIEVA